MTETATTPGIHHVTCVAADAQTTLDFWTETMGLRLVKRSVNQDDPETYHLFFADTEGSPGTSMTYFPWADAPDGTVGTGQVARTAFRVPAGSLEWWADRLATHDVPHGTVQERFGERVLPFEDPDGLPLELVAVEDTPETDGIRPWTGTVPAAHGLRGFHSVTLWLADPAPTVEVLEAMGFTETDTEAAGPDTPAEERRRFTTAGPVGRYVDVVAAVQGGRQGHGTVHHVAFRTPTDADQEAVREAVRRLGPNPTQQIDRHWFRSVYFREPGGVLFELATDGPGYDSDEPLETLGGRLVLPGRFEARREAIEDALPELELPETRLDAVEEPAG